jgi:enamine deaminase RidA (YjgF/YER057c/UK114 family)
VVFPSLLNIELQRASSGTCAIATVPDSVAEQTELALQRTVEILRFEGLTMADLVEVASYHVDLAKKLTTSFP